MMMQRALSYIHEGISKSRRRGRSTLSIADEPIIVGTTDLIALVGDRLGLR